MGNHEKIRNIASQNNAKEEEVEGGFWLERYTNKQDGTVEKVVIKNNVGDVVEFTDLEALRASEPFRNLIKAHYLNEGIVLDDNEVRQAAKSLADIVSYNALNKIDENREIEN